MRENALERKRESIELAHPHLRTRADANGFLIYAAPYSHPKRARGKEDWEKERSGKSSLLLYLPEGGVCAVVVASSLFSYVVVVPVYLLQSM